MTTRSLFRLAALVVALAAPLGACLPFGSGAPYDQFDQYRTSNGTQQRGAPDNDQHN